MLMAIMMSPIIERKVLLAVRRRAAGSLYLLFMMAAIMSLLSSAESAKATGKSADTNKTQLILELKEIDSCVLSSVLSFLERQSFAPINSDELKAFCKSHNEAYKCVREKSKNSPAIIRRGLVSLVTSMSRMTKKYCADPTGPASRKFVSDLKCVVDKHGQQYRETEIQFGNSFYEIQRQNSKDSVQQLKYICCSIYKYRRSFMEEAPGCPGSKATLEEVINSIIANNVAILCDDEQHILTDVCPKLAPLKLSKTLDGRGKDLSASALALFLIATLGE